MWHKRRSGGVVAEAEHEEEADEEGHHGRPYPERVQAVGRRQVVQLDGDEDQVGEQAGRDESSMTANESWARR